MAASSTHGQKPRNMESGLTRPEILLNVQRLCRSFGRNMAYYRAGWTNGAAAFTGNFWTTANNNFLDMSVLDYCKLFGERDGHHCWRQVVADPESFKAGLLRQLGLDEQAFQEDVRVFREYRDKWVAHLDVERKGLYPKLEIAKKAVWFYYEHVGKEQADADMRGKTIETGYRECEEEASRIYQSTAQTP